MVNNPPILPSMREEDRLQILSIIGEMQRELGRRGNHPLDSIAIHLISDTCEPQKMANSLQTWMGGDWLHDPRH